MNKGNRREQLNIQLRLLDRLQWLHSLQNQKQQIMESVQVVFGGVIQQQRQQRLVQLR